MPIRHAQEAAELELELKKTKWNRCQCCGQKCTRVKEAAQVIVLKEKMYE